MKKKRKRVKTKPWQHLRRNSPSKRPPWVRNGTPHRKNSRKLLANVSARILSPRRNKVI